MAIMYTYYYSSAYYFHVTSLKRVHKSDSTLTNSNLFHIASFVFSPYANQPDCVNKTITDGNGK